MLKKVPLKYITEREDLLMALDILRPFKLLALDTESYPLRIARASGLDPHTSRVRLLSLCSKEGPPYLFDILALSKDPTNIQTLKEFLLESRHYVAHNASYDCKVIKGTLGIWVKNIRCSMVGYQTLALATGHDAARKRGFSLQAMLRDILRIPIDKTEQKSDWSRPTLTLSQLNYAALDVGAPPGQPFNSSLLQCWLLIKEAALKLNMKRVWDLNQDLVPVLAMMEFEGLDVNKPYLKTLQKGLEEYLEPLMIDLARILKLPLEERLIMKGGQPTKVYKVPRETETQLNNKADLVHIVNKQLGLTLPNLASDTLQEFNCIPEIEKLSLYTRYAKQLSEAKKYLDIPNPITGRIHPSYNNVGTATNRSTSEGQKDEGLNMGLNIQQAAGIGFKVKMKGDPWGYNLDDLERTFYMILRNAIKAPKDHVLIDLDYAKQEILIGAIMTALVCLGGEPAILKTLWKDYRKETLKNDYQEDILDKDGRKIPHPLNDIYVATAVALFPELKNVPLEDLTRYAKKECPPGSPHGYRHIAKQIKLGIMYGKQAAAFAHELNCEQEVAEKYIKNWHKMFKSFSKYMKHMGRISSTQKRLALPWFGYLWVAEANAKGIEDKASIGRKGVNATIQGMGSIVMKLALCYMMRDPELDMGNKCIPLACIYDGLLVKAPGSSKITGYKEVSDGVFAPQFEGDETAQYYASKLKGHMIKAMKDVLEPILQAEIPAMVDIAGIADIWLH